MNDQQIKTEFENFIEWPTDDHSTVSTNSALIFARVIAQMAIKTDEALLRQALEALEGLFGIPEQWTGAGGGGVAVWRLGGAEPVSYAIAAICERLGET